MQPFVSIKGLHIQFPNQTLPAVAGISFDIHPGEMLAIVGESGSGKTLTALSLNGLLPSNAIMKGSITFQQFNNDVDQKNPLNILRGKVTGNIFQDPMQALNPVYTCGDQVIEAIHQHQTVSRKDAEKQTLQLFAEVELPNPADMLHRYPHQLSGGQQQRVMIAMAICNKPGLLIADEPTTALDASVQEDILQLIQKLQQSSNMSVLLITHNLPLVGRYADRILIMQHGHIVEAGETKEVLSNPVNAYTKILLSARPTLASKGNALPAAELNDISIPSKQIISSTEVLLQIDVLTKVYEDRKMGLWSKKQFFTAVDQISFIIHKNEILGVVGESGCGKTTLGKMLVRLIEPTSGAIFLNGTDILKLSKNDFRKMRKRMQIVFQNPYASLNPQMTLNEILNEPLLLHTSLNKEQKKERILQLIHQVKLLPEHLHRYPHQFSGGQRQRIAIARALATEPEFIVFDESVSALDVRIQASILNLINELRHQYAFSALFISHDLAVVHYISDRIMVMKKGKVEEINDANELFKHPASDYTRMLTDTVPR